MSEWDSKSDWGAPAPNAARREREPAAGNNAGNSGVAEDSKEWRLIEKTMQSMHAEARRGRRWGIFFKSLTFLYLFALLFLVMAPFDADDGPSPKRPHTALVDVRGPIMEDMDASADNLVTALRRAFENEHSRGVILRINSPGGSPVQAGYVYDEILRLRDKHDDKKLYAVISDLGASGAYYIAAAADEIFVSESSLVGSIGVIGGGFGFTGTMEKLGVERRLYAAGEHKAFLDPFSPEREEHVEFWESVLEDTHKQFVERVRRGRGDRLHETDDIFSGLVWNGAQAIELGLVDDLGSAGHVAREVIGYEDIVDYSYRPSPFQLLTRGLGSSVGRGITEALVSAGPRIQ